MAISTKMHFPSERASDVVWYLLFGFVGSAQKSLLIKRFA